MVKMPLIAAWMGFRNAWIGLWRHRGVYAAIACLSCTTAASSQEPTEYKLKAAFLYNFAVFTEWPQQQQPTLNLCVFGKDPFGEELDKLNGKPVGARQIQVRRYAELSNLKSCQLVFVPKTEVARLADVVATHRGLPVLVVAESPGATRLGVSINMNLVDGRITFEANQVAAREATLQLSSKMLRLATEVMQ